jgi:hypothetical protein
VSEQVGHPKVRGFCPMGCGRTLFLGSSGYVTCSLVGCPRPDAVVDLLAEDEPEHVVTFTEDGFTIRHPLRERLDGQLEDCDLHRWCLNLPGPPVALGQYRVPLEDGAPTSWQPVQS